MSNILENKIRDINKEIPNLKDFIDRGFDKDYATDIGKEFTISLKKNVSINDELDLAIQFNKYVEYRTFSVFGFQFMEYQDYEDYIHIGSLEADDLILIKYTSEIAILDSQTMDINFIIAPNFEVFLSLLPVLVHYEKLGYLGYEYTAEIKRITLKKIKDTLLSPKYSLFFEQSIPC